MKYVCYIVKADGIELDPTKVKSVSRSLALTNLAEHRTFMGVINTTSAHWKHVREVALPFQPLRKKNNVFEWMQKQ